MASMNDRLAHEAMNEQAEWAERNKVAMRRITPAKRNELQRYVIDGPYKREERNPRLGLLILAVSGITVCFGIWWALT